MNFSEFILAHSSEDPATLALSRSRYAGEVADFDLALTTLEVRRKLRDKVPEWYAVPSLVFPLRVSGEQCSSTSTARYKASIAAPCTKTPVSVHGPSLEAAPCTESASPVYGKRIADLTGGLGVDSWAFAQVFDQVLYNEMRPELADAAAHNFRELGVTNITVRNCELGTGCPVKPGMTKGEPPVMAGPDRPSTVMEVLDGFKPDVVFLDPARRAADGRKVFRLEDCQPDVLQLLPELLEACPRVLLKLSPMADITLVCKQLGCVKEVHVVAADGECKELLLVLEKDWVGPYSITIVEDNAVLEIPGQARDEGNDVLDERVSSLIPAFEPGSPDQEASLFEPGKAMLKAGAFELPCRYGLAKLGQHTHLYTGAEVPAALQPFGKCFRILESAPLDKRGIKSIGQKYPQADVTARNIPLTSDQLRAKLGVRSGGSVHIFGLHVDALNANLLFVAERRGG